LKDKKFLSRNLLMNVIGSFTFAIAKGLAPYSGEYLV